MTNEEISFIFEAEEQNNRKNNLIGSALASQKSQHPFCGCWLYGKMLFAKNFPCQPCEFVDIYRLKNRILWLKVNEECRWPT